LDDNSQVSGWVLRSQCRRTGYTHFEDEWITLEEGGFLAQAKKGAEKLEKVLGENDLINVRESMTKQEVCSETVVCLVRSITAVERLC
jgi:hypothetical protein